MPVQDFTPEQRLLSLSAVIAGALAVGVGIGALIPLIGLRLEAQGVDKWLIGATGGMVPLAILLFGPFVPRLIARLGTVPSLLAGFVVFNATVLLLPYIESLPAWMVLRFVSGMSVAVHWVVTETWMKLMATDRNRGRVMAMYVTAISTGFACGPLVIAETGIGGARPFFFVIAAMALSMVPKNSSSKAMTRWRLSRNRQAKTSWVCPLKAASRKSRECCGQVRAWPRRSPASR